MEQQQIGSALAWFGAHAQLIVPLILSLWMAWGDFRTRRIPNYLTFGTALAGLGFQLGLHGLGYGSGGLLYGLVGLALGFGLLIPFYALGGMGAGDVKALAALGAWLGPRLTFYLFIYMALSGGVLVLIYLAFRGLLGKTFRQLGGRILSMVLLRSHQPALDPLKVDPESAAGEKKQAIPYALALALGMAILCWRGPF